ncbi:transglutaminase-like domain-containing protein [Ruicaihuangia caeni]|uniref:transglutaminase-like domain-containing protein n=1 Tax=Ruicaihuangia caeni TaxID=3042517 RepID=UPI00338E8226
MTAATGIALCSWWPIYRAPAFVVMAAATIPAALAVAYAGYRWKLGTAALTITASLVFLIIGVPLAVPDRATAGLLPSARGIVELLAAVPLGWKRLLTISLPVGEYQALLVPAMVSTLCAALLAATIALRSRRPELAMLPSIALAGLGIAFGPESAWMPAIVVLGLLAVCLLWFMWCRRERRRAALAVLAAGGASAEAAPGDGVEAKAAPERSAAALAGTGGGSLLGAGAVFAVASLAALGLVVLAPPASDRTVARTIVEQPFDHSRFVSPLVGYRTNLQPERSREVLFTVRGLPEDARVRLTALDRWDGVVYGLADTARNPGNAFERFPYRVERESAGSRFRVEVEIGEYTGPWLPTVGVLESFEAIEPRTLADRFYYGEGARAAAVTGTLQPGTAYRVEGVLQAQPRGSELAALTPGTAFLPDSATPPAALTAWLDEAVGAIERPGARLFAAMAELRRQGYVSHGLEGEAPSRSGHSADRIGELFTARPMVGDAEQYAVAAALMARQIGFPARVVVGFAPISAPGDGVITVTGEDATAWIEVDTAEFGWVAIDPNPDPRPVPEREPQPQPETSHPRSVVPPPDEQDPPVPEVQTPSAEQFDQPSADAWLGVLLGVLRSVGAVLVLALVVLAPLAAVALMKARRRRARRRAPTAAAQIDGAWREFEDALVDHGFSLPASATRSEVAVAAGSATAAALAYAVDRAEFAPEAPAEDHAASVWHAVDVLRAELNEARNRRERLRALASPASLRRARPGSSKRAREADERSTPGAPTPGRSSVDRYSGKRVRRTPARGTGGRREEAGEAVS